jgi:hypothetical protein
MKAGIQIVEGVSVDRGVQAARLAPRHAICATVDWPLPPDDSDGTMLPHVIAALSQALAACGKVAFWHDGPLAGAERYDPPARATLKTRLLGLAGLGDDSCGIAVASDPAVIAAMFAYGGWSFAMQAALVFDPEADPLPILGALRQGLDWRQRPLPAGARLLFGAGHDGDFAIMAAADDVWLKRFKAALE